MAVLKWDYSVKIRIIDYEKNKITLSDAGDAGCRQQLCPGQLS